MTRDPFTSTEASLSTGGVELQVRSEDGRRYLEVRAASPDALRGFDGTAAEAPGGFVLRGPLSSINAEEVRSRVTHLRPRPVGLATSAGVGDRLGLATRGHALAFESHGPGVVAVFAQQSIREMQRLGREPREVLDAATFGALSAGWRYPVGADADHLKTTDDIDACLAAGFTSFTIDPGDHVRVVAAGDVVSLSDVPWTALEDDEAAFFRRYRDSSRQDFPSGPPLDEDIRRAAAKYGAAVAHVVMMYRHLVARASYPVEVEVAVDETSDVTTVTEHLYFASEMARLGVRWVGFAPRYVGRFEKGVEYIGDLTVLDTYFREHAALARAFGPYKLSLHSGSDKFSIYPLAMEATEGLLHLKTSGTSYLVALELAAGRSPDLFREIYRISREAYAGSRQTYQVSADLEKAPPASQVGDDHLLDLLHDFDSRQILHVGYSPALRHADADGTFAISDALHDVVIRHGAEHDEMLRSHIGRHVAPLARRT